MSCLLLFIERLDYNVILFHISYVYRLEVLWIWILRFRVMGPNLQKVGKFHVFEIQFIAFCNLHERLNI